MIIKPWAEFDSTLPNDQIDSEDEMDILQYPGKLLSETLAEILKGLGCEVRDLICLHERGWELLFRGGPGGRTRFVLRVTRIDKHLIGLQQANWWRSTFVPRHPDFVSLLTKLADAMAADDRFIDVRWFAPDEIHSGIPGALRPIET
ncbi:MAG: hypothetical protein IM643_02275 [Phenylobacterium sp.]|nr:hypothetical protein [Phenylobacterium sp.]